jgi:hypothetical protein
VLQNQLKALHLHACTRKLGIDLVGLVERTVIADESMKEEVVVDCVLRSPGLRPRHFATIVDALPTKVPLKGLNVVFPSRFTLSGEKEEVIGGKRIDLSTLQDDSMSDDREEEVWDAMDQEDIEAMNVISSAVNVKSMTEVDLEQHPRLVIPNFGSTEKAVDRLLKLLLPLAKIVHEKQLTQAVNAQAAAALREKEESMKLHRQMSETVEARRAGYRY